MAARVHTAEISTTTTPTRIYAMNFFFFFFKKYENSLPYIRLSLSLDKSFSCYYINDQCPSLRLLAVHRICQVMPSETNHSKPFPPYLYQLPTHFSPFVNFRYLCNHLRNFSPSTKIQARKELRFFHFPSSSPRRGQIKDPDIQRLSAARSTGEHNRLE